MQSSLLFVLFATARGDARTWSVDDSSSFSPSRMAPASASISDTAAKTDASLCIRLQLVRSTLYSGLSDASSVLNLFLFLRDQTYNMFRHWFSSFVSSLVQLPNPCPVLLSEGGGQCFTTILTKAKTKTVPDFPWHMSWQQKLLLPSKTAGKAI